MRLYLKIIKQIKNRDIMMTIIIIIAAEKERESNRLFEINRKKNMIIIICHMKE